MNRPIQALHDHPEDGPVVIVHCRDQGQVSNVNPAHAFGPFPSEADAYAFEKESEASGIEDDCFKYLLHIVGP